MTHGGSNCQIVFPADFKPFGVSYGEWSIKWWKWACSIPKINNPCYDKSGKNSEQAQNGPAWFLAGTFDDMPVAIRKCRVPRGKAILFPVIVSEKSYAEFPELKEPK
jgi:hypothetical protein